MNLVPADKVFYAAKRDAFGNEFQDTADFLFQKASKLLDAA
jgi:hypothetical protein